MLNLNSNTTFEGASILENGTCVAMFNASFSGEGSVYVCVSIEDRALYAAHKEAVDADFTAFLAQLNTSVLKA
jgi:hypothetical protein